MKLELMFTLLWFTISACSCRKEVDKSPFVTSSPVCSSTDLITLSHEIRGLSSNGRITSSSLYSYLERDQHAHWKLTDDVGSFDYDCFTYTSIEWNAVAVQAKYFLEGSSDPEKSRGGAISDLEIVVKDISNPERKMIVSIIRDGVLNW
jgi:hypothetical protein